MFRLAWRQRLAASGLPPAAVTAQSGSGYQTLWVDIHPLKPSDTLMQDLENKAACRPVDLWLVDLTKAGPALREIESRDPRLPPDQRAQIMKSANLDRNHKRLAAHVALRMALERVAGRAAVSSVAFEFPLGGKPALPGSELAFSISYARDHLLIGINRRGAIGVDLERPRAASLSAAKRTSIIGVAAALCPQHRLPKCDVPDDDDNARFLQAWTRMEAVAKATGQGIISLLAQFGLVGASKPESSRDAAAVAAFLKAQSLIVADLDVSSGTSSTTSRDHFAAIALGRNAIDTSTPDASLPDRLAAICHAPVWLPCDEVGLCAYAAGEFLGTD